jgi:hypothetical protein
MICLYLLEFLKFKEEHGNDFFHIVQTPNLACEITLQVSIRTLQGNSRVIVLFVVHASIASIMKMKSVIASFSYYIHALSLQYVLLFIN